MTRTPEAETRRGGLTVQVFPVPASRTRTRKALSKYWTQAIQAEFEGLKSKSGEKAVPRGVGTRFRSGKPLSPTRPISRLLACRPSSLQIAQRDPFRSALNRGETGLSAAAARRTGKTASKTANFKAFITVSIYHRRKKSVKKMP
jgi:hypothetical protein